MNEKLKAFVDELERRAKFHQGNANDPHNIGTAVYVALAEVADAIRKVHASDLIPDDPLNQPIEADAVKPYADTDLMNFGKHINQRLQDVPASYLHYLWSKRPITDARLEAYIKVNLSVLKQEFPDGIWT